MPDDSPGETRHEDGLRTDNSATPATSTGQPGPSPLANGAGEPAAAAPPGVDPPDAQSAVGADEAPTVLTTLMGNGSVPADGPGIDAGSLAESSPRAAGPDVTAANGGGRSAAGAASAEPVAANLAVSDSAPMPPAPASGAASASGGGSVLPAEVEGELAKVEDGSVEPESAGTPAVAADSAGSADSAAADGIPAKPGLGGAPAEPRPAGTPVTVVGNTGAATGGAVDPAAAPVAGSANGPAAGTDVTMASPAAGSASIADGAGGAEPPDETSDGAAPSTATGRRQTQARRGSFLRELPVLLVVAFGLALLIKTFLVQAFFIPSGSMEKTLHGCTGCSGDRVLVNKLVYRFHDPRPGDIVVFRGPESWAPEVQFAKPGNVVQKALRAIGSAVGVAPAGEKDFVKRVIAVGGQTVQCCDPQGRVVVDGRPLDEPYVFLSDPDYRSPTFGPIKVPDGRLWMMGDHRDESADSRSHMSDADQGTIGVSDVIGKAFVIVWPPSRWDTLGTPSTFSAAATASAPYVVGLGLVVPVGMVRHRRRRGR